MGNYLTRTIPQTAHASFFELSANSIRGEAVSFAQYSGKELQPLYEKYHDQGFEILAFPCNQFLWQEPGTNEEIEKFAREKHGATYTMMAKIDVNGDTAHPVYKFLKNKTDVAAIDWNFAKFLVDRKGNVKHYTSAVYPMDLEEDLKALLSTK